jgi:hypothetical protein
VIVITHRALRTGLGVPIGRTPLTAKLLRRNAARRIAANIAKLPDLLGRK